MADRARLVVTVTSTKTSSTVQVTSTGRYKGLDTNTEDVALTGLPVMTTASESAFWTAVLPYVQSNV
jgi:hypothetical protein